MNTPSALKIGMLAIFATLLNFSSMGAAAAARTARTSWTGVVTYVVDGDTVRIQRPKGSKPVSVRIDGIDAPEICQPGGTAARDALKRRVLGKPVVVQSKARDNYGRLVARIVFDQQDQGGWLVAQGLAWSYRYRNNAGPYAAQQGRAQKARLGMFSPVYAAAPVYPAEFRKKHGSCYARYR
ncbi:MAG: thermonuclease family protein [Polaromonas sp.]|nr:thermonuclease family protein [Polaromonas sp.]